MDAGVKGNIEGDVKMALSLARGWLEGGRIDNSQVRPLDPRIMPGYLHIINHASDPACFAFSPGLSLRVKRTALHLPVIKAF